MKRTRSWSIVALLTSAAALLELSCAQSPGSTLDRPVEPQFEVRASLSGYNLLWPSPRCCAFTLHVNPSGSLEVDLDTTGPDGHPASRRIERQLPGDEVRNLRGLIEGVGFFSLPPSIGPYPVDFDKRRIHVRVGPRSHEVVLAGDCVEGAPAALGDAHEQEARERACAAWRAVRALVADSQATVP